MSARALASAEKQVEAERIPDLKLKGFAKPVMAYSVRRMRTAAPDAPPTSSDAKKAAPG